MTSVARMAIILSLFLSTFVGTKLVDQVQIVPINKPLSLFPDRIGQWQRISDKELSDDVVSMLGVNDYINYNYQADDGLIVNLYVSYFTAVGVTGEYHSPRNCLPGSGWQIASVTPQPLQVPGEDRDVTVHAMMVQNGPEAQRSLYWYQNRGRIIASEYWEKFYLVWDAISKRRRDGSFVRIMYPWQADSADGADQKVEAFAARVIAILEGYIPGENLD